jgi:hypothetical protein
VTDWTTVAQLGTAAGTLALAAATFASVRYGNRSARVAERALQINMRPLLTPSRRDDIAQDFQWRDGHWISLGGGKAHAAVDGDVIYLAISVRNVGAGIAVLQGWSLIPAQADSSVAFPELDGFRRQSRDLYVPPNDVGFWQAALRDTGEDLYDQMLAAITEGRIFMVELLYSDHEGEQRAMTRFMLSPKQDSLWVASVTRHSNVDRDDPR